MAKVALDQAIRGRKYGYLLTVQSIAYYYGDRNDASLAARQAIEECYGKDLLSTHRVTRKSPGTMEQADLIIIFDEQVRERIKNDNIYTLANSSGKRRI